MEIISFFLALAAVPAFCTAPAEPPQTLLARVVSWDVGWRPDARKEWVDRVVGEVRDAGKDGADVVVFPELFAWGLGPYAPPGSKPAQFITEVMEADVLPRVAQAAKPGTFVVLGSYPHQAPGSRETFNRAPALVDGRWRFIDKLDPTPAELDEDPPIKPGYALPLFRFRGGVAAVVVCFSLEKPEIALALKKRGVQLVLGPSATEDENGVARVLRSASARAVELGAAVIVAPLLGEQDGWKNTGASALYLPAQKGIDHAPRESVRRSSGFARDDYRIPWSRLLELRTQTETKPEPRPFLARTPPFQVEID
ncbi:MAG: nitrilase-related carbon-nitrogen hydrolase [Elusimicrobiota bacterium]